MGRITGPLAWRDPLRIRPSLSQSISLWETTLYAMLLRGGDWKSEAGKALEGGQREKLLFDLVWQADFLDRLERMEK